MPNPKISNEKVAMLNSAFLRKPLLQATMKTKFVSAMNQVVNELNVFPTGDKVVRYGNKKYGLPKFRLKQRGGGEGIPESDSFWFTKNDQEVKLHLILEAYREEKDVYPLNFTNATVQLQYKQAGENKSLAMSVNQTPLVNKINILKEIQATAVVPPQEIPAIVDSIAASSGFDCLLNVKCKIKWKKLKSADNPATEAKKNVNKTGTLKSTHGPLRLVQKGNNVYGDYAKVNGSIEGELNGNILKGFFTNGNKRGQITWIFTEKGFNGKWRWINSPKWMNWNGTFTSRRKPKLTSAVRNKIVNWTGTWNSKFGPLRLVQQGNKLYGDYVKVNGTIEGQVRNNLAKGTFTNKNMRGTFQWRLLDEKFTGRWKWNTSKKWANWSGNRTSSKIPTLTSAVKSKANKLKFTLFKPQLMHTRVMINNGGGQNKSGKDDGKIKEVEHKSILNISYEKKNPHVFSEILDIKDEFKWHDHTPVGTEYLIYYRPTSNVDQFCFLPQVFRIKANMEKGEPRISIAMHTDDKDDWTKYRIALTIQIAPYFHPNAKKDLYNHLANQSNNTIVYPDLFLSGYKSAKFILDSAYSGENQTLRGKINEELDNINPSTGFNLSVECNLESFDFLKRELIDGITIGHIVFELEQQTSEGDQIIESEKIPVELNLRKLTDIQLSNTVIEGENEFREAMKNVKGETEPVESEQGSENETKEKLFEELLDYLKEHRDIQSEDQEEEGGASPLAPYGFVLSNKLTQEVKIGGLALTLLSKVGDVIYDADLDVGVEDELPLSLVPGDIKGFSIDKGDIDPLEENYFWTHLAIEPFSIRFDKDPEAFINRLIDYASGDPEEWNLELDCGIFSNWDLLSEDDKVKFRDITDVGVQIKKPSGQIEDVLLSKDEPVVNLKMSRTLAEILNTQSIDDRMYQIRQKNYYLTREGEWSEWKDIGETEVNYKKIYPITESK